MRVVPYLYFNGRSEEAIDFYRRAVGAKVVALQRFKEHPGAATPPGADDKVIHAELRIGDATVMASDGECQGTPDFHGFSLALAAAKDAEATRLFDALADGGRVQLPLMPTPFASRFGMVADRFGLLWTITAQEHAASA